MSESVKAALEMLEQQVKELGEIFAQAGSDLNTVAGVERVAKWKTRTNSLITQHLGPKEGQQFFNTLPGPSFTNDLLEELGDEVDVYRTYLAAMAKALKTQGGSATG